MELPGIVFVTFHGLGTLCEYLDIPSTLASSFHPSEYDKTYAIMYLHIIQDNYTPRPYMILVEEAVAPQVRISGAEISMSGEGGGLYAPPGQLASRDGQHMMNVCVIYFTSEEQVSEGSLVRTRAHRCRVCRTRACLFV
jgi:hypothetical protein